MRIIKIITSLGTRAFFPNYRADRKLKFSLSSFITYNNDLNRYRSFDGIYGGCV
jgi:hypothetical protein